MSTPPPSFSPRSDRRRPSADEARHAGGRQSEPTAGQAPRREEPGARRRHADVEGGYSNAPSAGRDAPASQPPSYAPRGRSGAAAQPPSFAPTGARPAGAAGPDEAPAPFRPVRAARDAGAPPRSASPARRTSGPGAASPAPPRRRRRRWPRVLAFLLVLVVAWVAFLLWDANQHLGRTDALEGASTGDGTTYLLAGSDSRADGEVQDETEGQRADSIMLVNVAPNGQTVAVSLPRDTYVEIPGYGWDKLNASYSYGGEALLVQTVEALTGLTVDHYVEIGMGGVAHIVDAVGGVELCLDMDVNDPMSGLIWQSGCHVADGTTALAFSRMRYEDPLGDIGRAQRQRQVVTKTISTALSPGTLANPVSAFRLERAGAGALTVDRGSSVLDVARLVLAFKKAGDTQMTGTPPLESLGYDTDAGSAVLLQDTTAPDFFARLRSGDLAPADLTAEIP